MDQQKPKTPKKNDDNEEVRRNSSHDLPEWLQEFRHGLVDRKVPERRDASSSSHELPSESRAKVVSGKHSISTHFPKDRNCDICLRTEITRASCRKRTGSAVPRAEKFGDLTTADHKVLSEGCESSWYSIWPLNGYNHTHVKQKNLRKLQRLDKSSESHRGNQGSFTLTIL